MNKIIYNICRGLAALIMLQTLFFKFSGAPESIYIFTKVGIEPWGRYLTGILELTSSVLLFVPGYSWAGALLGAALMGGALFSHLTVLGIEVMGDGGYLFILGVIVLTCCSIILFNQKHAIPFIKQFVVK